MSREHEVSPNHTDEQAENCRACRLEDGLARLYEQFIKNSDYRYAALLRDIHGGIPRRLPDVKACGHCGARRT